MEFLEIVVPGPLNSTWTPMQEHTSISRSYAGRFHLDFHHGVPIQDEQSSYQHTFFLHL